MALLNVRMVTKVGHTAQEEWSEKREGPGNIDVR